MPDYNRLLEEARNGAPKESFNQYMHDLVDPSHFDDSIRLRLLGNCIASCPANAAILGERPDAISRLLWKQPLGLRILYNGTVQNAEFSAAVLRNPDFLAVAAPSTEFKELMGSIWDSLDGDISRDLKIFLVRKGLFEILLADQSLETEPEIQADFKQIFSTCQKLSRPSGRDVTDVDSEHFGVGIKVVGHISSHADFTPNYAAGIEQLPFTWETVAVLVNLTAAMREMEAVLPKFPDIVPQTIELIKSEDGDDDDDELDYEEMPFDLELWGPLLRNLARDPAKAEEISRFEPVKLINRLLSVRYSEAIGYQFASCLAKTVYNHDLTEKFTAEPIDEHKLDVACSIGVYLSTHAVDSHEKLWAAPRVVKTVVGALLLDSREESWVRGTRTLVALRSALPNSVSTETLATLKASAPRSDAVEQNMSALAELVDA